MTAALPISLQLLRAPPQPINHPNEGAMISLSNILAGREKSIRDLSARAVSIRRWVAEKTMTPNRLAKESQDTVAAHGWDEMTGRFQ